MVQCPILTSFLTAVAFAARILHQDTVKERQTNAQKSNLVPGLLLHRSHGANPNMQVGVAPQPNLYGGVGRPFLPHSRSPAMSEQDSVSHAALPNNWKSGSDDLQTFNASMEVPGDMETGEVTEVQEFTFVPEFRDLSSSNGEDTLKSYLQSIRHDLLTPEEEKDLGRHVQKLVRWEAMLGELEGRERRPNGGHPLPSYGLTSLGRKATMGEWANACGFGSVTEFADELRSARAAKKKMTLSNLRLVVSQAKRYQHRGGSLTLLDLIQEGTLGLVRAVEKFDPDRGMRFSTYAVLWIRQAVMRSLDNKAAVIRLPSYKHLELGRLARAIEELSQQNGRSPTEAELADSLQITRKKLAKLLEQRAKGRAISIESMATFQQEQIRDIRSHSGEVERRSFMQSEVNAWLQELPAKDVALVQARFGLGGFKAMRYQEIAKLHNITEHHAWHVVNGALKKLRGDSRFEDLREYI